MSATPLNGRGNHEYADAVWPTMGAEAELYVVDRKAGVLLRVPLPVDVP